MVNDPSVGSYADIVAGLSDELRAICDAVRKRIIGLHRDHVELAWPRLRIASYGFGPKKMSEHYVYIAPQKNHVNLGFYHGASIADPGALLEGTGKALRHVKLRTLGETKDRRVAMLIEAAFAERRNALA